MASESSDDGWDWGWLIAIGLGCYIAYTQWWKPAEASKTPVRNTAQLASAYPSGPLATLSDGTVWTMEWESVKGPPTARLAWLREDHSKNKTRDANQTMSLFKINCTTSGYVTLNVVDYNKKGDALNDWSEFATKDSYAVPGSYFNRVVKAACLPQFDKLGQS